MIYCRTIAFRADVFMITMKKSYNSFFKRITACLLVALIVAQLGIVIVSAQNIGVVDTTAPNPVVRYNGAPLENDSVIPEDAVLSVLYEFNMDFSDLAGVTGTLPLPTSLLPSISEPISILGTDADGNQYEIGELKCDSGMIITADFFPAETEPVDDTPIVDEENSLQYDESSSPAVESYSGGIDAIFPDKPREPEPEPELEENYVDPEVPLSDYPENSPSGVIAVSIEIPCTFDLDNIPAAQDGELRTVTLSSDGQDVTVILFSNDVQVLEEPPIEQEELPELLPEVQPLAIGLLGIVPFYVPTGMPPLDEYATINDVALYIGTEKLTENEDVEITSFEELISLEYKFEITGEKAQAMRTIIASSTSINVGVEIPEGLKVFLNDNLTASTSTPLNATDNYGREYKFGDLIVSSSGVYIKFCGEFWTDINYNLDEASINVYCQLDKSVIGNTDTCEITLMYPKEYTITFDVGGAGARHEHTLAKKVVSYSSATREITWEVKFSPVENCTDEHYIFDKFNDIYQKYVPDSLRVGGVATDSSLIEVKPYDATTTSITYKVKDAAEQNKDVVVTYKTKVTAAAFVEGEYTKDTTLKNYVELRNDKDVPDAATSATASVAVTKADKQWLTKTPSVNAANKKVTWTVTITAFDFGLSDLKLTDTISAGQTLDKSSVVIKDENKNIITGDVSTPTSYADGSSTFTITISNDATIDNEKHTFTVTYDTNINEGTFTSINSNGTNLSLNNTAVLTFSWSPSEAEPEPRTSVNASVNNHIIRKAYSASSTANHTITWTITVNPYKLNVISGTITDNLNGLNGIGLTFKELTYDNKTPVPTYKYENGVLKIDIGNIGTETRTYTIVTEIIDPSFYGYNIDKTFTNTANFSGEVKHADNSIIDVTDKASVSHTFSSSVITKAAQSYDYSSNTSIWRIRVNYNKMPMPDAVIEDTLAEGLSYVDGSARYGINIDGSGTTPLSDKNSKNEDYVEYNTASRKLTFDLGNLANNTALFIFFEVEVDPNGLYKDGKGFKNSSGSFGITNSAILKREGYLDTSNATASATQTVESNILFKNYYPISTSTSVSYYINIDTHGLTLTGGKLIDNIPTGLHLIPGTVNIYEATVDKDGKFTQGAQVFGSNSSINEDSITVDSAGLSTDPQTLTITFGKALKRYVLTYDCEIRRSGTYNNVVNLTASGLTAGTASASKSLVYAGGGGKASSVGMSIEIIKKDGDTNQPLDGVEFELCYSSNGITYDKGKTDANGRLVFKDIPNDRLYKLVEKNIAEYDADATEILRTVGVDFASPVSLKTLNVLPIYTNAVSSSFTVYNYKLGQIEVTKRDGDTDDLISGVEFRLTDENNVQVGSIETTDEYGKLVFTELPRNKKYYLHEVTIPDGYDENAGAIICEASGDIASPISISRLSDVPINMNATSTSVTVYNYKLGQIEVIKRDGDTDDFISGVEFMLANESNVQVGSAVTTDASGTLVFKDLPRNQNYYLYEVAVPTGYDNNVAAIKCAASGDVASPISISQLSRIPISMNATSTSLTVYNYKLGQIVVSKLDGDSGKPIRNVGFRLTGSYSSINASGYTDADGILKFVNLPRNDTYKLEEISASGYVLSSAKVIATDKIGSEQPQLLSSNSLIILDKEIIGVTVYNYKEPPTGGGGGGGGGPYIPGTRSLPLPNPIPVPTPTPTPAPVPTPVPEVPIEPETGTATSIVPYAEDGGTPTPSQSGTTYIVPDINSPEYIEAPGGHGWPPVDPGTAIIYTEDGGFIELDDQGVPLGEWTYDEDSETWIFDEYVPLGGLPQTGIVNLFPINLLLLLFGLSLILVGLLIKMRGSKKND